MFCPNLCVLQFALSHGESFTIKFPFISRSIHLGHETIRKK